MNPNQRNPANVGPGIAPGTYALTGQNQGFEFQYGHLGGYQQPQGKPPNVQNIMSGTVVQNYAAGPQNQGSVLANVQGSLPINNYVPASTTSGTLPSMGTFVASFQQQNANIGIGQVFKGNVDTWMGQGQGANSLPSFGHFLMHQQSSPHHPQQAQQPQIPAQLFQGNQVQNRYPNTYNVNSQIIPNTSDLIAGQTASHCSNINANFSANFHSFSCANVVPGNSAAFSPVQGHGATLVTNYPNQFPSAIYNNSATNPVVSGPHIVASCNQVTNTTSSVITLTSTGLSAPVTAQVHACTSVSSTVAPSALPASVAGSWSKCDDRRTHVSQPFSVGCEVKKEITSDMKATPGVESEQANTGGGKSKQAKDKADVPVFVIVPFGWKRVHMEDSIVYFSPSNTKLSSLSEIVQYLGMDGTCKCGLECPVMVNKVFNFNTDVISKPWTLDVNGSEDLTKLCNHKRKIVAMAAFQSSQSNIGMMPETATGRPTCSNFSNATTTPKTKKDTKSKKKKTKSNHQTTPYDGLLVSQLIAQREKMKSTHGMSSENSNHPGTGGQQVQIGHQSQAADQPGMLGHPSAMHGQNLGGQSGMVAIVDTSHSGHSSGQIPPTVQCETLPASSNDKQTSPGCSNQQGQNTPLMSPTGSERSEVKSAGDDLGPISSGKQMKLDFSREVKQQPGELNKAPSQPLVSPTSPAVNRPQSRPLSSPSHQGQFQQNPLTVQTVFSPDHMKDPMLVQQSPHAQVRNSPHFSFPHNPAAPHTNYNMGMPMANSPVNLQHNHGMLMAGMQHQGNYPMYQFPNAAIGGYMGPPADQRMMPGQYHVGSVHGMNNPRSPYHMNLQHGMYHMPNPILSGMIDPASWTEQKKPRAKKPRAKKEKKKVSNVFESDTPPPNVDVSQLKDQGRGPIPKAKITTAAPTTTTPSLSFMENPTAFLAEQTALISNSLTSTLSSPTHSSSGGNPSESANSAKSSEESKTDTVDGDVSVTSAATSLKSSPNVVVHSSTVSKIGNQPQVSPASSTVSSSLAAAVGAVISKASSSTGGESGINLTPSLPGSDANITSTLSNTNMNIFTEDRCESLSPDDTCGECPPLTETMTPSSVVHHTPAKNAEELTSSSDSKKFTSENNTFLPGKILHVENSLKPAISEIKQSLGTAASIAQLQDKAGFGGGRNFGNFHTLQQMLGHHASNQFPASNLLSAAARAQMAQQQQQQHNVPDVFNTPQPPTTSIPHLSQPAVSSIQITPQSVSNIHVNQKVLSNIQPLLPNIQHNMSNVLVTQTNVSVTPAVMSSISKIHSSTCNTPKQAASALVTQISVSSTVVPPTTVTSSDISMSADNTVMCTKVSESSVVDVSSKLSVAPVSMATSEVKSVQSVSLASVLKTPDSASISTVTVPVPSAKVQCQSLNGMVVPPLMKQNQTDQVTLPSSGCHGDLGSNVVFSGNVVSQGEVAANVISTVSMPVMTPVASTQTPLIPNLNNVQQGLNPQAMMNLFQNIGFGQIQGNPGFNTIPNAPNISTYQSNPIMMSGNLQSTLGQDNIHCLQLQNAGIPTNFGLNGISGNQFQQYIGGSNGLGGIGVDTSGFPSNFGKSGQLMQLVQGDTQAGCVQIKGAMATPACDIAQPVNKVTLPYTEQVMPSAASSQSNQVLLLPNLQMPLLQVMGSAPVNVNSNMEKAGLPQFGVQNTDIQTLIGQLQASLSQIGTPLNMMNVQQVWNNLTTGSNLTAMQLQTLQLQQQLLQQIQQLQGMQTLISQFNMQSQASNTITTIANKDNDVMTAGSHVTLPMSSNSNEVKQEESSLSMVTMVNDVSTTTESPPNNLVNDNDCDSEMDDVSNSATLEIAGDRREMMMRMIDSKVNSRVTNFITDSDSSEVVNSCSNVEGRLEESLTDTENMKYLEETSHGVGIDDAGQRKTGSMSTELTSSAPPPDNVDTLSSLESKCGATEDLCENNISTLSGKTQKIPNVMGGDKYESDLSNNKQIYCSSVLETDSTQNVVIDLSTKSLSVPSLESVASSSGKVDEVADVSKRGSYAESAISNRVSSTDQVSDVESTEVASNLDLGSVGISEVKVSCNASPKTSAVSLPKEALSYVVDSAVNAIVPGKRPLEEDVDVCQHDDTPDLVEERISSDSTVMFCEGDLIWGQIRGFPSWPGRVVPPSEVIDPEPLENGKMWIKWYGDHTFTQVEHDKLKTLAEGLQAHQRTKKKNRKGRKMNSNLEAAIQEAIADLDQQAAIEMEQKLQSKSQAKLKPCKKKRLR